METLIAPFSRLTHMIRDKLVRPAVPAERNKLESKVLYEHEGILVVQLASGKGIETQMMESQKINEALQNAGVEPSTGIQLILDHLSEPRGSEEDQFADDEHTVKTEHVQTKIATTGKGEKIAVYKVEYFPAAARHADDATVGVHTRDWELILGDQGMGMLEIAPIITYDGELVARKGDMVRIPIKENTLAILPPNKQGNRWKFFEKGAFEKPGLVVTYLAYPGPYDSSTVRQAKIQ